MEQPCWPPEKTLENIFPTHPIRKCGGGGFERKHNFSGKKTFRLIQMIIDQTDPNEAQPAMGIVCNNIRFYESFFFEKSP